ncbi:transcriptional regulator [Ralstonia solanacearum]|nr:hypothetical protein LBM341_00129 [Ralstonia solanacearum]BEU53060.1 hypothetical protein MAFF211520_33520 [Ralstonia pseudosolanacearum]NJZ67147.1 transcriptional regulator [Ralstonia solanacearum]NJZ79064.1 transcriptional regulator [Ralstonia solanacearum]NJZ84542.1 transcriptional regulator [Ralstonia solanacearum]
MKDLPKWALSGSLEVLLHYPVIGNEVLIVRLIEPDEQREFLATLQRNGQAEDDFELLEVDTTDPKGDENFGLQGYVTVTRLSTKITREYPLGDGADWVQHFRKELEAGTFNQSE